MYYFIEPMREEDIEEVQEVEQASFHATWSANTYRQELQDSSMSRYIVARSSATPPPPRQHLHHAHQQYHNLIRTLFSRFLNGQNTSPDYPLVGYGGLWIGVDEGHITTIAVHPIYRGRSIGELLLNGLIDMALQVNLPMLTLEVRVSNLAAQGLYSKYGFLPAGHRPKYYSDNGEDALIMWTTPIQSHEYQEKLRALRWQLFSQLRAQTEQHPYQQQKHHQKQKQKMYQMR